MTMQVLANTNEVPKIEQKSPSQASTNLLSRTFVAKSPINDEFKPEVAPQECSKQEPKKSSLKLKAGILATTLTGVSLVMASVLKKKGLSLNLGNIFKTSPKNWSLFKVEYGEDELPKVVAKLALASVGGGILGGALFDKKENFKAKIRESIIQLVGNIFTPLLCVWGGGKLFQKIEPQFVEKITAKIAKTSTKEMVGKIPRVIVQTACLVAGIFLGNKVGNTINHKAFHNKEERKLKITDMSPHLDDVCISASLVDAKGVLGTQLARIVPAALMIAGVSTGMAQESPENLAKIAKQEVKPDENSVKAETADKA